VPVVEAWRAGGREGGREGGKEEGREGGRKGEREGIVKNPRNGGRERGKEGGREVLPVRSTNASSPGSSPSRFPFLTRASRAGRREGLRRSRDQVLRIGRRDGGRREEGVRKEGSQAL